MGLFDPDYATEVLNDILGRHGLYLEVRPKDNSQKCFKKEVDYTPITTSSEHIKEALKRRKREAKM